MAMLHGRPTEGAVDFGKDAAESSALLEDTARLLESKLAEFTRGGAHGGAPLSDPLKRILDFASSNLLLFPPAGNSVVCGHSCQHHNKLVDLRFWGRLPQPVLFRILTRLPLPKLVSLQLLSRHWRASVDYSDEDSPSSPSPSSTALFLRACEESRPLLALLSHAESNRFCVRVLDWHFLAWHHYELRAGDALAVEVKAISHDGGLVCFVSTFQKHKRRTFQVDVVNPLTKHTCALPLLQDFLLVQMAQIVVDPETREYVVVVAGEEESGVELSKFYDPNMSVDKWVCCSLGFKPRLLYGHGFHLGNFRYHQRRDKPSVYDMKRREVFEVPEIPIGPSEVKSLAMKGDRVFVLKKERSKYSPFTILEFRLAFGTEEVWDLVELHRCQPFEMQPHAKFQMMLYACQGFLVVLAVLPEEEPFRREIGWVYCLATEQWKELPPLPGEIPFQVDDLMCRMHWNVAV